MGEENTTSTDGGQASTSGAPQAGTPTTDGQAPVSQQAAAPSTDKTSEHERVIAELRKENAAARKRLADFDEERKQAELAKLGDLERVTKQHTELQSQYQAVVQELKEVKINAAVERQAHALGFRDPEDAVQNLKLADIEFDEGGKPTNVAKLLDKVAKAKPYLLKETEQAQSATAAQTAQQQQQAPAVPAFAMGRSAIQSPATARTPGQIPSWNDVYSKRS